jgi:hypothetical protein
MLKILVNPTLTVPVLTNSVSKMNANVVQIIDGIQLQKNVNILIVLKIQNVEILVRIENVWIKNAFVEKVS